MIRTLAAEKLSNVCTPESIEGYLQAAEVPAHGIIGQERAQKALKLGLGMKAEGFNVFVSGIQGTGKLTAVKEFLESLASIEPTPPDWCYVNNFKNSYQPQKISLPAGQAHPFKKEVKSVVQEALHSMIRAFESEAYAKKRQSITDKFEGQQNVLISSLNERAEKESLMIKQTPWEIYTVPLLEGKPMSEKQFDILPVKEKEVIHKKQDQFADEIKSVLQQTRKMEKETSDELAKLEKEVAEFAIANLMKELIEKYGQLPDVKEYLKSIEQDILENLGDFLQSYKPPGGPTPPKAEEFLKRYEVNVLIDNSNQKGAPIVIESNPTYNNLIGRVEKESIMGTLVTDFTMIRKGSLHSANGGYLIIRAEELFKNYFSWGALKRAIRNKEITMEEATDQLGYLTTKTLKPDAIPLQVKVILIGDPYYYFLLYEYDSDFKTLFKVKSDFDTVMERSKENISKYVQFARTLSTKENLTKPDSSALCKLIEYGSRLAQDQQKLSTRFEQIADVLREANHYAVQEKKETLTGTHIIRSIEEKIYRSNLIQSKINEMIQEKTIFIDITGNKTGQVNGLSVIDLGDIQFGKPNRITSTVNMGKSGILTIEREAELSGPLHTKGVMILTGYLAEKFFQDKPTSLSARLVFEQSYSEVEGDSASSTELYALLSNLADLPIKQGIAVTGSVNQKGEIQAIGGVNEKIEGYFEVCKLLGLNGEQGVIIPSSNEKHLALKQEVIDAVNRGQFHIWCVDTVEDGIEILTGCRAGNIAEEGTVFNRVNKMLIEFAERMKEFEGLDQPEEKTVRQKGWTSDIVLKK